ncbi:hypothetical protein KAM336_37030 [Aeromonas caviae]|uniref:Uncharacterized protein n=1 Tax=Aeromonas caviae TaxID=648 RepID=A0AA37FX25_AERCA|nr:hypothetical protein KAM336_37030 [Aeromonas caviae]GJA65437.1 hypothetical protein KAM351_40480 [Aeromonas caviae]
MSDKKGGRFHVDKSPKGGAISRTWGGDFTWISAAIHRVYPQFGRSGVGAGQVTPETTRPPRSEAAGAVLQGGGDFTKFS